MATATDIDIREIAHDFLPAAVAAAVRFCPGARCPRPVLQTVKVSGDGACTLVTATDLEHRITVRLNGGMGRGTALVPAAAAKAIAKAGGGVRFSDATVSAGGITAPMDDPMEYPCGGTCTLPVSAVLRFDHVEMLSACTAPAVDNESSRFALGGIRLESEPGRVVAVGTDGRRLHCLRVPNLAIDAGPLDVIVHPVLLSGFARAVRGIAREVLGLRGRRLDEALAATSVEVRRSACDHLAELRWSFGCATVCVEGREIDGRFPKWRDIFHDGCHNAPGFIALDLREGAAQMLAARQVTTEMFKGATFAGGEVSSGHESSGTFRAPIAGSMHCPPIKLDPSFLLDAIDAVEAVGGTEARFSVTDGQSGVYLRHDGPHDNDPRLAIVIMPLAAD